MKKIKNKLSRKARIRKKRRIANHEKKQTEIQKKLRINRTLTESALDIFCHFSCVSDEVIGEWLLSIFQKYTWDDIDISYSLSMYNEKQYTKIRIITQYLLSKDVYEFVLDGKYQLFDQIDADAYHNFFRIGAIKDEKDKIIIVSNIQHEIRMKRKGIKSEFIAYQAARRLFPNHTIVMNDDLDAVSIDMWIQDGVEDGWIFQTKSSLHFVQEAQKKFELKKHDQGLDGNRYKSLIERLPLNFLIVDDDETVSVFQDGIKIPFKDYVQFMIPA